MAKKIVELSLMHDIQTLVKYQEFVIKELPPNLPKEIFDIQNDILTVLKTVQQIEIVSIDVN